MVSFISGKQYDKYKSEDNMKYLSWVNNERDDLFNNAKHITLMEFAAHGFDVYTSSLFNRGVHYIIKAGNEYHEVHVVTAKIIMNFVHFSYEDIFDPKEYRWIHLLIFPENKLPEYFFIPIKNIVKMNNVFINEGDRWTVELTPRNKKILSDYCAEQFIGRCRLFNALEKSSQNKDDDTNI